MAEGTNSARIIDLNAYRSMRRGQQSGTATGQRQDGAANPFHGGFAMQLCWFWPTWVWVPMAVPPASVAWDAS